MRRRTIFVTILLIVVISIQVNAVPFGWSKAKHADWTAPLTSTAPIVDLTMGITSEQVIDALIAAGYPLADIMHFDEKTDPNQKIGRPGGYYAKASFEISDSPDYDWNREMALSTEDYIPENTIEIYADEAEAKSRADYIIETHKTLPMLDSQYIFLVGTTVLRIEHAVLPDVAEQYEAAVKSILAHEPVPDYAP